MAMAGVGVSLDPVPETLLWTLWHRAVEARRPDSVIDDPLALALVERIDFAFADRFGNGESLSQWQALRARCFDGVVGHFLAAHHGATVVSLGEGLETQLWRVDDERVHWVTVDLPDVIELRRALLPAHERNTLVASSALEPGWLDAVDPARPVLVTAQGLLMYLAPDDVHRLIGRCAARLRPGALVFDAVPRWLAERSRRGGLRTQAGYEPPAWSWGVDGDEERRLRALPHVAGLQALRLPRGRGVVHGWVLPVATRIPAVRRRLLSVLVARFA
jgi:O-methyltransferase involved in polyketide biosynthesis